MIVVQFQRQAYIFATNYCLPSRNVQDCICDMEVYLVTIIFDKHISSFMKIGPEFQSIVIYFVFSKNVRSLWTFLSHAYSYPGDEFFLRNLATAFAVASRCTDPTARWLQPCDDHGLTATAHSPT